MSVLDRLTTALAGRYRVDRELGAGGMATVYLAHDLKHERDVAIKVLHPDLGAALGGERFLSEIKVTAKLQHPHILPLLDSGAADGLLYYVMPYVRGETLRARLERESQLPVADALRIAREVAGALDHAHKQGIIHRDIKPENILLQDGAAVVADFGIALAVQQAGGQRMTQTGLSLGTPQYMSPEQAMGERTIDARSDIYALGAVTYEMLTGEPPFGGASVQAIVAKVLTERPVPPRTIRDTVSADIESAVLRALAKLPADRPESAHAFAQALAQVSATTTGGAPAPSRATRPRTRWLGIPAAALVGLAGGWALFAGSPTAPSGDALSTITTLEPLAGERWRAGGNDAAISPDGRRAAIVATTNDWDGILIRSLDSVGSRYLANTEGARSPFWSPDGSQLGFLADRQLQIVDLASGAVRALCPASVSTNRASWGADDVILYVPEFDGVVHQASPRAPACRPLGLRTVRDSLTGAQVDFLSDGRHFVLSNSNVAWLGLVGEPSLTRLLETQLRRTVSATDDYLLFSVPDSPPLDIVAQRVDVQRGVMEGTPLPFMRYVLNPGGRSAISVAKNGTMLVRVDPEMFGHDDRSGRYARFTREGALVDSLPTEGGFGYFRARNDGSITVGGFRVVRWDRASRGWTEAVKTPTPPRTVLNPVWAPGDSMLAVARGGLMSDSIVAIELRTGSERQIAGFPDRSRRIELTDWTTDGRYILFEASGQNANPPSDAWVADVATGKIRQLFTDAGDVFNMRVSPDGALVAYELLTKGRSNVFVRPFPGPGAPVRITSGDGRSPRWSGTRELIFVSGREVQAVALGTDGAPGTRRTVVPAPMLDALRARDDIALDVSPDGRHVVIGYGVGRDEPLLVLTNWRERLPRGR